jgi:tRNA dimethylallyltransferase
VEAKPKIIIIMGPTAVGKTELSLDLASEFGAEIISADSMQVYRHLDIGTSKPTREERQRVTHHLIDLVDPDGEFNAALFSRLASGIIGDLQGKKNIFVVGGTGLYVRTLIGGIIGGPGPDDHRKKSIREKLEREDRETLYRSLGQRDPLAADRIHPHDRLRIIRALETVEMTGEPISERQSRHGFRECRYDCLKVGLFRDREELYSRINDRATEMIQAGLVEETEQIIRRGYSDIIKPLQSLGYRTIIQHISNKMSLAEALRTMQRDTRHYARRQMTWFRKESDILWFHPSDAGSLKRRIDAFLHRREGSPEGRLGV